MNDEEKLFNIILGKHLRRIRDAKGLTREYIAGETGLDPTNLGKNERGEKLPNSHTFYKLHKCLGFNSDRLFTDVTVDMETSKRERNDT